MTIIFNVEEEKPIDILQRGPFVPKYEESEHDISLCRPIYIFTADINDSTFMDFFDVKFFFMCTFDFAG